MISFRGKWEAPFDPERNERFMFKGAMRNRIVRLMSKNSMHEHYSDDVYDTGRETVSCESGK